MNQIHQQDRDAQSSGAKPERNTLNTAPPAHLRALRTLEVWHQLSEDPDLWLGPHGVIVNSAALAERKRLFALIRVRASTPEAGV